MLSMHSRVAVAQRLQQEPAVARRIASTAAPRRVALPLGLARRGRQTLQVSASTLTPRMPNSSEENDQGERNPGFNPAMGVPNTTMAKGGGGGGGMGGSMGSATLERSKPSFVMPTPTVQGPKLDDGSNGGDIGKINRNGGGGGDGGGDDDDDYFGEEDGDGDGEGEGAGNGFFRQAIPESYDTFSIGAVLAEWMKTVQELPAILRQAVQMGLFSSAQLVRFFSMDVRPTLTRTISRQLPPTVARDFVGRLMADPGFVQKMVMEASFAALASLWYESRARGDKFKSELDLALINTLGMAAATGATVWLLAPSRSYGSLQKFPWQQMLEGLPNCVFDMSGPLRSYTKQARAAGFCAKMAELSAVGALTGTVTSLLATAAVAVRQRQDPEWAPSVAVPSIGRSSGGLAAFFALNANVRYQLIGGLDRFLFERTNFLWTYLATSCTARLASNQVGETSRAWWQGLPAPSSLVSHAAPTPRKIKKKVSKKVPRSRLAQATAAAAQQQPQLALEASEVMGMTLAAATSPLELYPAPQAYQQGESTEAHFTSHPQSSSAQWEDAASAANHSSPLATSAQAPPNQQYSISSSDSAGYARLGHEGLGGGGATSSPAELQQRG